MAMTITCTADKIFLSYNLLWYRIDKKFQCNFDILVHVYNFYIYIIAIKQTYCFAILESAHTYLRLDIS